MTMMMSELSMYTEEEVWWMGQPPGNFVLPDNQSKQIANGGLDDFYGKAGEITEADFCLGGDFPLDDLDEISADWVEKYVDLDDITCFDIFDNIEAVKVDVKLPWADVKDEDVMQMEDTLNQLIELETLAGEKECVDGDFFPSTPASIDSGFSPCPSPQYTNLSVMIDNSPSPYSPVSPCSEFSLCVNPITCEPVDEPQFTFNDYSAPEVSQPEISSPIMFDIAEEVVYDSPVSSYDSAISSPFSSDASSSSSPPSSPEPIRKSVRRKSVTEKAKSNKKSIPVRRQSMKKNRKERKKDQNKSAATRYRQKKKAESEDLVQIEDEIVQRNKDLKSKVKTLATEINYLKRFLKEIMSAKNQK